MALVNVGTILAGRGFRVLMMDLDLEAPGLSYLKEAEQKTPAQPGFIDLIQDVLNLGTNAPFSVPDAETAISAYVQPVTVPEEVRNFDDGALYIMPAGTLDEDYEKRLLELDLPRLYREGRGQPLMQLLKQRIIDSRMFDYVLIDSRTGFSEESGICIRDLGDRLMLVMGLNRQNVQGTARFLRRMKASGINPESLDVILSPIPVGEDELYAERRKAAGKELCAAWEDLGSIDLEIPYHPRLALTEEPYVFRRRQEGLYEAYCRIEERVRVRCGDGEGQLAGEVYTALQDKNDRKARELILRLARINREQAIVCLRMAVSRGGSLDTSRPYFELWLSFAPRDAMALGEYAVAFYRAHTDPTRAEKLFEESLSLDPEDARILGNYASFLIYVRKDYDQAEELFQKSLEIEPTNTTTLGNYASFLVDACKEYEKAESFYRKVMTLEPENAVDSGNYAKLLFVVERRDEAINMLRKAFSLQPTGDDLLAELWFYAYAHQVDVGQSPLPRLAELLRAGKRSPDWPLEANVERAIADGHPEPEFLAALAEVISGGAPIESLDSFDVWSEIWVHCQTQDQGYSKVDPPASHAPHE
ncbi:MAG: hypothetical protein KAI66_02790 [Lentisphaeria bacterium]|nr:hypothetical protein [Lentisphaeria bacterium]